MSVTLSGVGNYGTKSVFGWLWDKVEEAFTDTAEDTSSVEVPAAASGCRGRSANNATSAQVDTTPIAPPPTTPAVVSPIPVPQENPTPPPPPPTPTAGALITWAPTLDQEMDGHDSANWQTADWSNGDPFNNTWQPHNISFNDGIMSLILDNEGCPGSCRGLPYASGEYRTMRETYGYGYYETRMRPAAGSGLMSGSFFIYRGTYGKSSHDEIDFEFLGKDCHIVQTNYYVEGRGNHERIINLDYNACEESHNYGFRWSEDLIAWYVDGREVNRAEEDPSTSEHDIPYRPGKIIVNLWTGTSGLIGWLGDFSYPGHPLQAQYDWIKYSPLDAAGQQPVSAPPTPTTVPTAPTAPTTSLTIASIQQGSRAFNNGSVTLSAGIYEFSASRARDPGFKILTGNHDLQGRNTLVFEIKGNLTQQGNWARFIAQVYDDGDNDVSPSISLDPVELTSGFQTITVDLQNQVDKVQKVQFLLVTDNGSCQVEIRNIRFESAGVTHATTAPQATAPAVPAPQPQATQPPPSLIGGGEIISSTAPRIIDHAPLRTRDGNSYRNRARAEITFFDNSTCYIEVHELDESGTPVWRSGADIYAVTNPEEAAFYLQQFSATDQCANGVQVFYHTALNNH